VITVKAHKIAYMALPKAACSSIKKALAAHDPDAELNVNRHYEYDYDRWHEVYPTTRFRPHRWEDVTKEWFGFTVVRDPVKRLMACYTNRVVERRELEHSPKIRKGIFDLPVDPDPDFFFQNISDYQSASSVIKHHSLHTWLFTGRDLSVYDAVYTTENIGDLSKDLSARLKKPFVVGRENSSTTQLTLKDLRPETIASLKPWLCSEYGFLIKYFKTPPPELGER
jgi:hypothetical protein